MRCILYEIIDRQTNAFCSSVNQKVQKTQFAQKLKLVGQLGVLKLFRINFVLRNFETRRKIIEYVILGLSMNFNTHDQRLHKIGRSKKFVIVPNYCISKNKTD